MHGQINQMKELCSAISKPMILKQLYCKKRLKALLLVVYGRMGFIEYLGFYWDLKFYVFFLINICLSIRLHVKRN